MALANGSLCNGSTFSSRCKSNDEKWWNHLIKLNNLNAFEKKCDPKSINCNPSIVNLELVPSSSQNYITNLTWVQNLFSFGGA
jgi:hypothetical protein